MPANRTLSDDIYLLGGLLGEVIQAQAGQEAFDLEERVRALGKSYRGGDDAAGGQLAAVVAGSSVDEINVLIRAFTNYFQLINLSEDNERIRRIRSREAEHSPAPRRGSIREAIAILRDLEKTAEQQYVPPYNLAIVYASLHNNDQAFRWLEKSYQERSDRLVWLQQDPMLDGIRTDERFENLLKRVRRDQMPVRIN